MTIINNNLNPMGLLNDYQPNNFVIDPMQVQQAQMQKQVDDAKTLLNRQRYGNMMLAFADVLKGRDPSTGVLARQQHFATMKAAEEQKKKAQQLGESAYDYILKTTGNVNMAMLAKNNPAIAEDVVGNIFDSTGSGDTTLIGNVKYIDSLYKRRDKFPVNSKAYNDLSNTIRNAEAGIGAYKYDVNRQSQLAEGEQAAKQGRIGESVLTDAQINSDKAFGTWYTNEWLLKGGGSTEQTYIESLKGVRDVLANAEKSGDSISGVSQGVLSKFPTAQAFFNPEGAIVQDRIASVAQLSLKAILGGQFSEREGELLIQRAYNPLLSEAENIERLTQLINRIDKAENYKKAAAQYYEENKSISGFKGQKYAEEEFRSDIESFYRQDMKLLTDDALEQEYLTTDSDSIYFKVLEEEVQKRQK
tara:strand:+ start:1003 stop:2253 length:1251 start_codon:yes stop_codon:yes gene_type:complete